MYSNNDLFVSHKFENQFFEVAELINRCTKRFVESIDLVKRFTETHLYNVIEHAVKKKNI